MAVAALNPREVIGGNSPPGPLQYAAEAIADVGKWLIDVPAVTTEEEARQAGLLIERITKTFGEVEDERDAKVRPLNERVAAINAEYKSVHNTDKKKPGTGDRVLVELRDRLTAYAKAEEEKRIAAVETARKAAEEAERIAREAEAREREAIESAKVGEVTDVATAIAKADEAFSEFGKASRFAQIAERDVPVRIASGLGGRALTMRTTETLVLVSYNKAIKTIGPNEKIETAILSAARDYRKLHGKLPDGVTDVIERKF